jgi:hypothetical protein
VAPAIMLPFSFWTLQMVFSLFPHLSGLRIINFINLKVSAFSVSLISMTLFNLVGFDVLFFFQG